MYTREKVNKLRDEAGVIIENYNSAFLFKEKLCLFKTIYIWPRLYKIQK